MDLSHIAPPQAQPLPSAGRRPVAAPRAGEAAEAAKQFEALLLRQFVEEAFKPMFGEAMVGGAGKDVYQYLMTDALAKNLADSHSFGFSSLVQLQLNGSAPASPLSDDTHTDHGT